MTNELADASAIAEAVDCLVSGDGAKLRYVASDPTEGAITLRLELDGVECGDCVVPRSYLQRLALSALQPTLPHVRKVIVEDPREDPSWASPASDHS